MVKTTNQKKKSENYFTLLRVIPTMTTRRFVTGKSSGILSDISSGIRSGSLSGISSGISSGILSEMLSGVLSGISSGILSGRWGPAVLTELGRSQVEVQRCSLSSEGPTELGRSQVEVQRCPLRSHAGSWGPAVPTACGSWRRVGKAEVEEKLEEEEEEDEEERRKRRRRSWRRRRTTVIKSNNPHLAGGEIHGFNFHQSSFIHGL